MLASITIASPSPPAPPNHLPLEFNLLKEVLQVKVVGAVEVAVANGFHDVVLADGDA